MSDFLHSQQVFSQAAPMPDRWAFFLHGIFGSGRNWNGIAKRVVERSPGVGAVLVDLRLHGQSTTGFSPPHTVEACGADVQKLAARFGNVEAIVGHSFGGKVALAAAPLIAGMSQVWVVDSSPGPVPKASDAWMMLSALRAMPGPFVTKKAAFDGLKAQGFRPAIAQWMTGNLVPGEGGLRWRFGIEDMAAMLADYSDADFWGMVEAPATASPKIHFIQAEESEAIDGPAAERIEAASRRSDRIHLHRLAGHHWIHVDNPDGVVDLLASNLTR